MVVFSWSGVLCGEQWRGFHEKISGMVFHLKNDGMGFFFSFEEQQDGIFMQNHRMVLK